VDWQAIRNSGVRFGFARVSDGLSYPDARFQRNWSEMRAKGILRGAYQFFRAGHSALDQAKMFVAKVGQLNADDLPPVVDVEAADGYSASTILKGVRTWLDYVENALKKRPIIYTSPGFWNGLYTSKSDFSKYSLWLAHYTGQCPDVPSPWSNWKFWQYSDSGSYPGISGPVDTNYFNGSYEALLAFAKNSGTGTGYTPPAVQNLYPLEISWERQPSGSYDFRALGDNKIVRVGYFVDGYPLGSIARERGYNFPLSYSFSSSTLTRKVVALGFDAKGEAQAQGIGLLDVTQNTAVYIRQKGKGDFEIGLERPAAAVGAIEVDADTYPLTDSVTKERRSKRLAVRTVFTLLQSRNFSIDIFGHDGQKRGTLYRTFTLE
jgi:GH25 family lysozyme M1 (1,4-beta-N-acetylmuramidase)